MTTNPTEALDAVEQALRIYSDPYNQLNEDGEELRVPDFYAEMDFERFATEALAHLATLKQQVAELVAFREAHQWRLITELTRDIKGEVLFIERIGGDSSIEDTFAGTYCDTKEHGEYWFDCFVNPSANAIPFRDVVKHYTHFLVATPPAAEGGQDDG